jgi:hypothetical protein
MLRKIGCGCGALLLALATLVGYLYLDLTRREPRETVLSTPPTPAQKAAAEETVQRLERQVEAPAPAAPGEPPRPKRFRLRITEEEANQLLTSYAAARKALAEAKVRAIHVRFEEGQVIVSARVPAFGNDTARVTAAGRLSAQDGKLAYELVDLRLGSVPMPEGLRKKLQEPLEKAVTDLNKKIKGRLEEIQIADGVLQLEGERG